jgi:hypothetical protein
LNAPFGRFSLSVFVRLAIKGVDYLASVIVLLLNISMSFCKNMGTPAEDLISASLCHSLVQKDHEAAGGELNIQREINMLHLYTISR